MRRIGALLSVGILSMGLSANSAGTGGLKIDSEIPAKVSINGVVVGTTPFSDDSVAIGNKKVTLVDASCTQACEEVTWNHTLPVNSDVFTVVKLQGQITSYADSDILMMSRSADQSSALHVISEPLGAQVFVDDKEVGLSPLKIVVNAGQHKVRVEKQGYSTHDVDIFSTKGYVLKLESRLSEAVAMKSEEPTKGEVLGAAVVYYWDHLDVAEVSKYYKEVVSKVSLIGLGLLGR